MSLGLLARMGGKHEELTIELVSLNVLFCMQWPNFEVHPLNLVHLLYHRLIHCHYQKCMRKGLKTVLVRQSHLNLIHMRWARFGEFLKNDFVRDH